MNTVILIGRLVRDPELKYLPGNGMANCRFTLAVDKGLSKDKKEEFQAQGKPTADFIQVVVWGKMAENCANYLAKGSEVAVEGSIQTGSYDNAQGQKVYTTDVLARNVQFLSRANSSEKSDSSGGFVPVENSDDLPF